MSGHGLHLFFHNHHFDLGPLVSTDLWKLGLDGIIQSLGVDDGRRWEEALVTSLVRLGCAELKTTLMTCLLKDVQKLK